MRPIKNIRLTAIPLLLWACTGIPENAIPVDGFERERYLGKWYEIARLDHSFERGLEKVTADYSLRDDGGIHVVNRGYDTARRQWKEAIGKAYAVGDPTVGRLKVSFWGPFYSSYNIIALDHEDYAYAMVCGPTRSYLWILARTPQMDPRRKAQLIAKAQALGFKTDSLIHVAH